MKSKELTKHEGMAKAFLSHSSKDKPKIDNVAKRLGPHKCHYDSLTFEYGEKTIEEIFSALADSDIFVLFLSDSALESPWVKREIREAKTLQQSGIIERIFPLIIDDKIEYSDPRIPDWIKKPYNIKHFESERLIYQKIDQLLRESNFRKYSHLRDIKKLFVGRHKLLGDFEIKITPIDGSIPSCIVAYSFFEGIGRRSFLKTALIRTNIVDPWYEPIPIPLNSKESIEDFIYKLNFVEKSKEVFKLDLSEEELAQKIETAKSLLLKFSNDKQIIFIIDNGGIVLPNNKIVPWFVKIITSDDLRDRISVCLVSKFKPHPRELRNLRELISFQIDELTPPETQTLFVQYLKHLGITIAAEDTKFFVRHFHGIPEQVIYTANLISSVGVSEAKMYTHDIEEFDQFNVLSIVSFLNAESIAIQIIIALSKVEIISYDLVFKIFGETDEVYKAIQQIFDLGLFYNVTSTHEYLKLNTTLTDYINRSRLELSPTYEKRLREIVNASLDKPLDLNDDTDYSMFLLTLQGMIRSKIPIPSKYFLPSFILKAITEEYYSHKYDTAIELSKKIIDAQAKFDTQIIRETRYWLCLSYCRNSDQRLFDEVQYFRDEDQYGLKDYYFLIAFYYRNSDDMERAEEYFNKVLEIDPGHSRSKRELINVYLRKHEFAKALSYAKENYERFKNNIHHINAYFTCLIKVSGHTQDELNILLDLLERTRKSLDKRAMEFYSTMNSEYEYYVSGNKKKAIKNLLDALKLRKNDYHAFKALLEIYRREGMSQDIDQLLNDYSHLAREIEY